MVDALDPKSSVGDILVCPAAEEAEPLRLGVVDQRPVLGGAMIVVMRRLAPGGFTVMLDVPASLRSRKANAKRSGRP